jgi:hypothetical protein
MVELVTEPAATVVPLYVKAAATVSVNDVVDVEVSVTV